MDSEYFRHLVRQDQTASRKLAELRQALRAGEASGPAMPLDMAEIKAHARQQSSENN